METPTHIADFEVVYCKCSYCKEHKIEPAPDEARLSAVKTPWALKCANDGIVYLTNHEFNRQVADDKNLWACPKCGTRASLDDANLDAFESVQYPVGRWAE